VRHVHEVLDEGGVRENGSDGVDIINETGSLGSGLDREAGAGPDSLDGDVGAMPCVESVEQCGTGLIHLWEDVLSNGGEVARSQWRLSAPARPPSGAAT
jgi:hypothetical protein